MKKKISTTKKVIISIFLVFLLLIASLAFAVNHFSSKIERVEIDRSVVTATGKEPVKKMKMLFLLHYLVPILQKMNNTEIYMVQLMLL